MSLTNEEIDYVPGKPGRWKEWGPLDEKFKVLEDEPLMLDLDTALEHRVRTHLIGEAEHVFTTKERLLRTPQVRVMNAEVRGLLRSRDAEAGIWKDIMPLIEGYYITEIVTIFD